MGFCGYNVWKSVLLISTLTSTVFTFPTPSAEHPRTSNNIPTNNTNESDAGIDYFNQLATSSSSKKMFSQDEEEIIKDWPVPEFLEKILPSTSFFSSSQAEETDQTAPNSTSSSLGVLSRLFSNVIIDRPSVFRVQFYNSDFEDSSSSPDDDNSTGPNVVFGSPLCLGLCVPVQVFSENTSIHFLSDKQISLFPAPGPTPLYPTDFNTNEKGLNQKKEFNVSTSLSLEAETSEDGDFGWLSSWIAIPTAPSLSKIQSSIQLPEFPTLPTGVSDLIG